MNLFTYSESDNTFYIFYPHITTSVNVEIAFDDRKTVVFDDDTSLIEFLEYLDDNSIDVSDIETFAWGSWELTALDLNDLIELK